MVWILRTKPRRLNCHNIIIIIIIIINALARFSHSAFFPTRVEFLRLFQMQTRGRVGAAGLFTSHTSAPSIIQAAG